MVDCINILYPENWLSAASVVGGGGRIGGFMFFTRFRPFGVDLQRNFFSLKILLPEPISPASNVYVKTSYHTTFHQNILINVACIHKRVLVPSNCQNSHPPLEDGFELSTH